MNKNKKQGWAKKDLISVGVYERACKLKGLELDQLYEEDIEPPRILYLTNKEARKLGLN